MSKQSLNACAGAPARTANFEGIEVFTYTGGEDTVEYAHTSTRGRGSYSDTLASGTASGDANNTSHADTGGKSAHRYCEVIFVLRNDVVDSINYRGLGSSRLLAKLPHRQMGSRGIGRRDQACDLLFACFPFLPKPDMVDPERPQARR